MVDKTGTCAAEEQEKPVPFIAGQAFELSENVWTGKSPELLPHRPVADRLTPVLW